MAAAEIEIILNRQLADCLSVPVFIVDPVGTLLFYNEPAEKILGKRFEETGEMLVQEWSTTFEPIDAEGKAIPADELPLMKAMNLHEPAHKSFWIRGFDRQIRSISVTAYPIIGRSKKISGAVSIFWINKQE